MNESEARIKHWPGMILEAAPVLFARGEHALFVRRMAQRQRVA